jgi:hypothetical protein
MSYKIDGFGPSDILSSTIAAAATDERLITAGTYYIQLENIESADLEGVFTLGWEELP